MNNTKKQNSRNQPRIATQEEQLDKKLLKERQTQIYSNETLGRLLGEVVILFTKCGCKVDLDYSRYVQLSDITPWRCMMNIHSNLKTLYGYQLNSSCEKLNPYDFPDLSINIEHWRTQVDKIQQKAPLSIEYQLLSHVIGCLIKKKMEKLPESLSDRIFEGFHKSEKDSGLIDDPKRLAEELMLFKKLADESSRQVQSLALKKDPIIFSTVPLLETSTMIEYKERNQRTTGEGGIQEDGISSIPIPTIQINQLPVDLPKKFFGR
jgi:hypothetical protein